MMTCLQATNDVSKYVTELLNETAKYNITRFHKFLDHGLEVDSYRETLENLRQFQRRYRDKDDTDSDSDDNDIDEGWSRHNFVIIKYPSLRHL